MKVWKLTPVAAVLAIALAGGCTRTETSTTPAERARGVPDNAGHTGRGPDVPMVPASGAIGGGTASTRGGDAAAGTPGTVGGTGSSATTSGVGTTATVGAPLSGVSPATGTGMGTVSGTNTGTTTGSSVSTTPATGTAAGAGATAGAGGIAPTTPIGPAYTGGASGANDTPRSPGIDRGSSRSGDQKGSALDIGRNVAAAGPDAARTIDLPLVPTAGEAPATTQQQMPRPGAAVTTITTGSGTSGTAYGSVKAEDATRATSGGAMSGQPVTGAMHAFAPADRHFMTEAAVSGLFEVAVGKLAMERGSDGAVKEFGRMLVDDHSAANDELRAIAAAHSVTLPARLPRNYQAIIDGLAKEQGRKFDQEFVQKVGIRDHRSDIRKFERAAKTVPDAELKAFAEKTLPTLRKHYEHAQKLKGAAGGERGS